MLFLLLGLALSAAHAGLPADLTEIHLDQLKKEPLGMPLPAAKPIWSSGGEDNTDLSLQYADPVTARTQGSLGDCHIFAAVTVLEAAYFRQYGQTITLSEADLFLQRQVLTEPVYNDLGRFGVARVQEVYATSALSLDLAENLRTALANGVAQSYSHYALIQRIYQHKKIPDGILWADLKLPFRPEPRQGPTMIQKIQIESAVRRLFYGGEAEAWRFDSERESTKNAFRSFRLYSRHFLAPPQFLKFSKAQRLAMSRKQKSVILRELEKERPVAVGLRSLKGLSEWHDKGGHDFAIIGYRTGSDGLLIFKTRNSWGGQNPDVHEDELYHFDEIASVRVPADRD